MATLPLAGCVTQKAYRQLEGELAALEQLREEYYTDSDGDGVMDHFDHHTDPADTDLWVDTHGVPIDTDRDGIPDSFDQEPCSPAGSPVDQKGVALEPDEPGLTESKARELIDETTAELARPVEREVRYVASLPVIYFEGRGVELRPAGKSTLYQVAQILRENQALQLVVTGYAFESSDDCRNQRTSYARAEGILQFLVVEMGISRHRLYLNFHGSDGFLFGDPVLDERAELSVATEQSLDQDEPKC